jgi:hypothetical protein
MDEGDEAHLHPGPGPRQPGGAGTAGEVEVGGHGDQAAGGGHHPEQHQQPGGRHSLPEQDLLHETGRQGQADSGQQAGRTDHGERTAQGGTGLGLGGRGEGGQGGHGDRQRQGQDRPRHGGCRHVGGRVGEEVPGQDQVDPREAPQPTHREHGASELTHRQAQG